MGAGVSPFLVRALGWTLVHALWQVALIALLYRGLEDLLQRRSARLRHLVGCAALALSLAVPVATLAALATPPAVEGAPAATASGEMPGRVATDRAAGVTGADGGFEELVAYLRLVARSTASAGVALLEPWTAAFLPVAWLLGLIIGLVRLAESWRRVARLSATADPRVPGEWRRLLDRLRGRLGVARPVRLLRSPGIETPVLVGWRRPAILIPATAEPLPRRRLQVVLAHELAHVRRHDFPVHLAMAVTAAMLFFHPAFRWLLSRVRLEREVACDEIAAGTCDGGRVAYARELAGLEAQRVGVPALAAGEGNLMRRVRLLVAPESIPRRPLLALALCLVALVGAASLSGGLLAASEVPTVLDGLDPVRLADGDRVPGSPMLSAQWRGHRYQFVDAASRDRFQAAPDRYAVRNVALCPISGRRVRGDVFRVVEGRIFLFCCPEVPEHRLTDAGRLEAAIAGAHGAD